MKNKRSLSPRQKLRKAKTAYCRGTGTYAELRTACKKYVASEVKKAKPGTKTATKKKASKSAQAIVKSSCSIR